MLAEAQRTLRFVLGHPIGQRRPVRCTLRMLAWQLKARLNPGPHLVPFVGTTRLWASRGETGVSGNIYVGLHEFREMAFVLHLLRPGDLFADVGANAGSYTVLASGVTGAHTVAIEPVPESAQRLERNVSTNGINHLVTIERCAVGQREGVVRFSSNNDTMNRILGDEDIGDAIEVSLRRLDHIFEQHCPLLIKIDVEGNDHPALDGAGELLSDPRLAAIIVELSTCDGAHSTALLERWGFRAYRYDPWTRKLKEQSVIPEDQNTIFVRDAALVDARLRQARKFKVLDLDV